MSCSNNQEHKKFDKLDYYDAQTLELRIEKVTHTGRLIPIDEVVINFVSQKPNLPSEQFKDSRIPEID